MNKAKSCVGGLGKKWSPLALNSRKNKENYGLHQKRDPIHKTDIPSDMHKLQYPLHFQLWHQMAPESTFNLSLVYWLDCTGLAVEPLKILDISVDSWKEILLVDKSMVKTVGLELLAQLGIHLAPAGTRAWTQYIDWIALGWHPVAPESKPSILGLDCIGVASSQQNPQTAWKWRGYWS